MPGGNMKLSRVPLAHVKRLKDSRGQTLIEYGLLLILVAVVIILAITFIGQKTCNTYSYIGNNFP